MPNPYFQFKKFIVFQDRCAMKVTTDACLFGAWIAHEERINARITHENSNVLDIGTGTGLLSLMYAQINPAASIDAIEIDEEAFAQAGQNVGSSVFSKQIHVVHADVKTLPFQKKYDRIIVNPPFYDRELISPDERKNIARHQSGLQLEELTGLLKRLLTPGGEFYLLLPYKRKEAVKSMLLKQDLSVSRIIFVKQSPNHDYFRMMIRGALNKQGTTETIVDEFLIRDDNGEYTSPFKELLKDYYLDL